MDVLITALKAAAEPTRLRLLALLAKGDLSVSELVQITGQSQPRISRHLRLLSESGLLERVPEGSWVFYRIASEGADQSAQLAHCLLNLVDESDSVMARDRAGLAEIKAARDHAAERYFHEVAADWDRVRSMHVDETEVERALADAMPAHATTLLDLGTGTGRMLELFAPRVAYAEGIDRSHEMLSVARAKLGQAGIANATVRQADIFQLPFEDASYDIAIIHQVLHFLDRPGEAIREAARTLKPGGRLIVVDFAPHDLETLRTDHAHRRLGFSEEDMVGWFGNAHLKSGVTRHLSGDPLTVSIWQADHE